MTLWLLPLLPAVVGAAIAARQWRPWLGFAAVTAVLVTLALSLWAAADATSSGWGWGPLLDLSLQADGLAGVAVLLVPAVAAPVVAWAAVTSGHDDAPARLVGLLVVFVGAMQLLVLAADLLTLLIGWELVGVMSWALIGHRWRDPATSGSALTAYLTTRVGDIGLFLAAGAALAGAGSLRFDALDRADGPQLTVVAAGVVFAAAAKSAQVPFAPWLFAAMAGPTPASALLHSATMVAAGAYALARLSPVLQAVAWFGPAVVAIGLVTALAAGVVAAAQHDLKRALAASTSAQYGLMLVAVGAGAVGAAAAHLVTHAAFKALLFLAAGVVLHTAGSGDMTRTTIGWQLPRLAGLFTVGVLALAAVPPLGAAFSKEAIVAAAAHESAWLAAGVLAAGGLSAMYAARLQLLVFPNGRGRRQVPRPPAGELAPVAVLAAASVLLGLLWLPGAGAVVERVAGGLVPGTALELAGSSATVAAGLGAAWVLWRRGALSSLGLPDAVRRTVAGWLGLPVLAHALIVRPVWVLARALAHTDDRVVDAGIRASAAAAAAISRLLAARIEFRVDGVVRAVGLAALSAARLSRITDDQAVDRAVEGAARLTGAAGERSRQLQTGLAHQYYVIAAVGAVAVFVVALVWR